MRNSESVKEPAPIPEHGDAARAVATQITPDQNAKRFRVVKSKSRIPGLGRHRVGQSRMGRWDPPRKLLLD